MTRRILPRPILPRPTVLLVALSALALAGCGNRRVLKPEPGHDLPRAPYGSTYKPNADQLLKPPVESKPERNVDARVRSEERGDDPFNLPPEN
ncbi:argininosuccinate lyase [Novosphingobium sp. Fuku2-ISO-50]|uniref:argininosuccinate lyase n=1 Tax=Novosphingobium sp. Fuku2-ISO-50 TaxID=1739114 RepID=UPI00076C5066|nr:argininosuccinate lyase [Novosphingobium sp. Fuku2-ISO-50]KUR80425.1 argininosuccinate lyase [Novosphingobium sp. Fuku2-ISO-50]